MGTDGKLEDDVSQTGAETFVRPTAAGVTSRDVTSGVADVRRVDGRLLERERNQTADDVLADGSVDGMLSRQVAGRHQRRLAAIVQLDRDAQTVDDVLPGDSVLPAAVLHAPAKTKASTAARQLRRR